VRTLVYAAILCALSAPPCPGEAGPLPERPPADALHVGLSLGVVADFWSLPPYVYPARSEVYFRCRAWESTLRYNFLAGSNLDLSLDVRLAPRSGAYLPACGIGIRLRSAYSYDGAGVFLSVVPCRFDVGPLIGALMRRRCPEVLLSIFEFRFGSVLPELFSAGGSFGYLFTAELTLLRVGIGI